MPTASTLPLIVLVILLWRWTRGNVLSIVAFTAIFNAASALNFGILGVSPWIMALVLCLPFKIAQGRLHARLSPGINRAGLQLLMLFLAVAIFSGMVYPFLFHGVPVVRGIAVVPLDWGMANVAQLCYLCAAAMVFYLTVTSTPEEIENAVTWYLRGCIVATFIAMYQLANAVTHVPYPEAVFYSNTSHVIFHAYKISGLWQLNSTFTEASDMAGSLIGALGMLGWQLMTRPVKFSQACYFGLMFTAIVMTMSTTGYACLGLMAAVGLVLYCRYMVRSGGMDPAKLLVCILLVAAGCTIFLLSSKARETSSQLMSSVVFDKKSTDSYKARTESHGDALQTLADTYYMGSGLGSTRASGLAFTLLAGVGVPGLLVFALAYGSLFLPVLQARRRLPGVRDDLLERSLFAVSLLLCGMVLAGSEPNQPILWFLFGVALVARPGFSSAAGRQPGALAGLQGNYILHLTQPEP